MNFKRLTIVVVWVLISTLLFEMSAWAAQVKLKDGTLIVGEIQQDKLKWRTSYGDIDIDIKEIVSIADGKITLKDGTIFRGHIAGPQLIIKTRYGDLNINTENIVSIVFMEGTIEITEKAPAPAPLARPTLDLESLRKLLKAPHYVVVPLFESLLEERQEDTRTYTASYNMVFTTLVEAISAVGNPILTLDKENGLIVTDYMVRRRLLGEWRDRYSIRLFKLADGQIQVGARRTVEEAETKGYEKQWIKKVSNGVIEAWILDQIGPEVQIVEGFPPARARGKPKGLKLRQLEVAEAEAKSWKTIGLISAGVGAGAFVLGFTARAPGLATMGILVILGGGVAYLRGWLSDQEAKKLRTELQISAFLNFENKDGKLAFRIQIPSIEADSEKLRLNLIGYKF